MSQNQTIDGVPRKALEQALKLAAVFDDGGDGADAESARGVVWILRALLDAPAVSLADEGEMPAAQPQGEPVAWRYRESEGAQWRLTDMPPSTWYFDPRQYEVRNLYERASPAAVVPAGRCIMPRQLTAENGAKALLLGEFNLQVTMECPECCDLEEPTEGCSICDGEGEYGKKHTIPWDKIKFIYSKAVSGLALKAESPKSR